MEIPAREQHPEIGRDLEVERPEAFAQFSGQFGVEILAHEVAVELGRDEPGRGLLFHDDGDHVLPVECASVAQERLLAVVVVVCVECEVGAAEVPSRERARALADVGLGVVAWPHGEEFHDFPGKVFVRRALDVDAGVEERQHGRVFRHGFQQCVEVAQPLCLEQLHLLQHLPVVAHLVLVGGEVAMPEERGLFLERALGSQHAVGPPVGHPVALQAACPQPVEEFVDHRLHGPVAARLDLDAEGLAICLGGLSSGRPARRKRVEPGVEHTGVMEWRHDGIVRHALEIHETAHCSSGTQAGQRTDFPGSAAESRAFQKMCGTARIPRGFG